MNRFEKLLKGLDLDTATGIEVGALDKPIVSPTSPGVFYVDHVDTPALREKYGKDPCVNVQNLVEVGGVWGEKTLAEAAASVVPVDYFVASHVIEHVPDLIAWLKEVASVLKPSGESRLAIPDRRYSFDILRAETVLADVVAAHLVGARIPQIRQVIDHVANVASVDCARAWDEKIDPDTLRRSHPDADIERIPRGVLANQNYFDVHCWVFTPLSFARLMARMAELDYHAFACREFHDTERHSLEFIVVMRLASSKEDAVASWRAIASQIERTEEVAIVRQSAEAESLRARLDATTPRLASLEAAVQALGHEVEALRASTSWRITAPLRLLATSLRKITHKPSTNARSS